MLRYRVPLEVLASNPGTLDRHPVPELLSYSLTLSLPCSLLGRRNPARHHTDVLAVAPGGDGLDPGDSLAVAKHFHAVDGFDDGGIVAQ